ncbi:MAG: GIY-YIG nuclease family protein [Candidatus Aenigmarchaeota archaeon]|nr:GIY-YIG nuclease family protein [Candidatus Aenigmarchaeota archaeon]
MKGYFPHYRSSRGLMLLIILILYYLYSYPVQAISITIAIFLIYYFYRKKKKYYKRSIDYEQPKAIPESKPKSDGKKYSVYVLKCKTPNHYYIGITRDFSKRFYYHIKKEGSRFTQVHGVDKIEKVIKLDSLEEAKKKEKELTIEYMKKFGSSNVAGAGYSQLVKNYPIKNIPSQVTPQAEVNTKFKLKKDFFDEEDDNAEELEYENLMEGDYDEVLDGVKEKARNKEFKRKVMSRRKKVSKKK